MIYIFLGLHFFLVSANLAWRAKEREKETGIKSDSPFPIKKKEKKKREVQTKVPVSEDVLVHQVASGLVLGGESKLLDRRVLLQGLDKHALRLAGDGLSLVGNPQLLDSVVLQQNLGQGLKTGATDATKKKYQEKKKRERVSEGRFFKERKGGSRHVALNVEAGEGLVGPKSLNQGNGSGAVDGAVGHQELGDDGVVGQGLSQPGEDLIVDTPGKKKITRNVSKGKEVEID